MCDSRIGFLFCGILTVCTVRIFSRKVFHFTRMRKPKIFCFHLYYTGIYRKVNPVSVFHSSIFNKFPCIKSMQRYYVNLHHMVQSNSVLYLPSRFWYKGKVAYVEARREHLSPQGWPLGSAVYLHASARWEGKIQVRLRENARYCQGKAAGGYAGTGKG